MIDEAIEEIREMQTHSSSAVAITATNALSELLDREFATPEEYRRSLDRNASALRRANPSHASLQSAVREVVDAVDSAEPETVEAAKHVTQTAIERVVEQVEQEKGRAAARAAAHIDDGSTILTHDYSSTVLEGIEGAVSDGKHLTAYVSEARPRYLGRKSARTLAQYDTVETHLIVDSAWGHFMPEIDAIYVGMDCIVDGILYNRVGTFPLAITANELGVPMYVVGSGSKVVEGGFVFENEFRSPSEVMREPAEGFIVENPAYDATPVELLAGVITDDGIEEL